jgi:hypothetical protein
MPALVLGSIPPDCHLSDLAKYEAERTGSYRLVANETGAYRLRRGL